MSGYETTAAIVAVALLLFQVSKVWHDAADSLGAKILISAVLIAILSYSWMWVGATAWGGFLLSVVFEVHTRLELLEFKERGR